MHFEVLAAVAEQTQLLVSLLGHDEVLPAKLQLAARCSADVRSFLSSLEEDLLEALRGRVYCTSLDDREEFELKKGADGAPLDTLLDKRRALAAEDPDTCAYVGELRRATKYRHELDGRWAKTVLKADVKDWLGQVVADAMPYWDRYDEGVFVGGRFAGSPMHVDQAPGD